MSIHPLSAWKDLERYNVDSEFRRRVDMRIDREEKFSGQRLFNLDIEVTNDCNLSCKTCYNPRVKDSLMTVDEFCYALERGNDLVQHLGMDGIWITISGGEPTSHPNLWTLLHAARQRAFVKGIALITNGTLIDQKGADEIVSINIDEVMVSLDGPTASINDAIRGRGTFDRAMNGIEILRAALKDVFLGSTLTLTAANISAVEDYVNLVFRMGFNYAWVNPPLYTGRLPDFDLAISYEDHLRIMQQVRRLDTKYFREAFSVYYNIPYYPITDPVSPYVDLSTACPWGKNNLTITSKGDVLPCLYSRALRLGNVFQDSLSSLYEEHIIRKIRDGDGLGEPCRSCQFRSFCGGCRARTYYLTGDWSAPDPWCPLARGDYHTKTETRPLAA